MALTPQQIYEKYELIFADNNNGDISEADMREFGKDITDALGAASVSSIIPVWAVALTFQTDGTDDGEFCRHPDTSGNIRLWQTKTDDNNGNEPPTDPNITENTNWLEVSASSNSAFVEWSAGLYGSGLVIVFFDGAFYKLEEPIRPFNSTDIVAEITAEKWSLVGGSSADLSDRRTFTAAAPSIASNQVTLNFDSKNEGEFRIATTITAALEVLASNTTNAVRAIIKGKITGTFGIDLTEFGTTVCKPSGDYWTYSAGVVTIEGDTATSFEISLEKQDTEWNIIPYVHR